MMVLGSDDGYSDFVGWANVCLKKKNLNLYNRVIKEIKDNLMKAKCDGFSDDFEKALQMFIDIGIPEMIEYRVNHEGADPKKLCNK